MVIETLKKIFTGSDVKPLPPIEDPATIELFQALRSVASESYNKIDNEERKEKLESSISKLDVLICAMQCDCFDKTALQVIEKCVDFIPDGFPNGMQHRGAAKDLALVISPEAGELLESKHQIVSRYTMLYANGIAMENVQHLIDELKTHPDDKINSVSNILANMREAVQKIEYGNYPSVEELEVIANIYQILEESGVKGDFCQNKRISGDQEPLDYDVWHGNYLVQVQNLGKKLLKCPNEEVVETLELEEDDPDMAENPGSDKAPPFA